MNLKYKLVLSFLVVSLLIWAAGFYTFNTAYRTMQDSFAMQNNALAKEIMYDIDRTIYGRIELFSMYTTDEHLRTRIMQSNDDFSTMDDVYRIIQLRDLEWISTPKETATPFMMDIMKNDLSKNIEHMLHFYQKQYGYKVYGEAFLTNRYGAVVAMSGKTTDYRQDDEKWWQDAMKEGWYTGDISFDASANMLSMAIGIRVNDQQGTPIGVLKTVVNMKQITDILTAKMNRGLHPQHTRMNMLLLTGKGNVIFSTNKEHGFLDNISSLSPGSFPSPPSGDDHSETGMQTYANENTHFLITHVSSTGFKDYGGNGWSLMIIHDKEEAYAPIIQLKKRMMLISAGVTIIAFIVGLLISMRIAAQVTRIKKAAVRIEEGHMDYRIDATSHDEIGDLASAINKMSDELKMRQNVINETMHQLSESEEKYRMLFDNESDAIIVFDAETLQFEDANRATMELYGYSKEEFLSLKVTDISAEKENTLSTVNNSIPQETGSCSVPERMQIRKDGTVVPVEISVGKFISGGRTKIIEAVRNISARKQAEEERRALEAQLRQAQKMEAVGQLAGGIAHDFNNILAAIINYNYIMRDMTPGDPDFLDLIDRSSSLAERASHIVSNLLTYSRNQYSELKPVNINDTLDKLDHFLRPFIGEDIDLVTLLSEDDLVIMADENQIGQCIMNLAVNARDAMPDGGRFTIQSERLEMNADLILKHGFGTTAEFAVVSITDTGTGIDEENRKKIFDPFFTTKEVGKGTGLGLSIIYGILKQHGGYVDVVSNPGHGTTFKLYFPMLNESVASITQNDYIKTV